MARVGGQPSQAAAPKTVAGGRYEVGQRLGAGSFGDVYRGLDLTHRAPVAIKFEDDTTNQLQKELEVLRDLQGEDGEGCQGFTRILYFGKTGNKFCLVMECLGKSLQDRFKNLNGRLNVQSTLLVAQQMLNCVELLHSKGIVHRDIKPDNFVCGVGDRRHYLYLIDFGLAEWYYKDGGHVPMKREDEFKGTMRYASVNAQRYLTQSRRDDLEACGYTWLYFLTGTLPWSGVKAADRQQVFMQVREMKESTPKSELCEGQPKAFEDYMKYVSGLGYAERPDYNTLKRSFIDLRAELSSQSGREIKDQDFEWEVRSAGRLAPLQPASMEVVQPDDICNSEVAPVRQAEDSGDGGWSIFSFLGCGSRPRAEGPGRL